MCGIIFASSADGTPVNGYVLEQYTNQKHRGSEGFGIYDGKQDHLVRATKEHKIKRWLGKYNSDFLLFHHRFPTSTKNVKRAAHPFSTKDYFGNVQYILAHNGHITNSRILKLDHEELGITYSSVLEDGSFNDSESLLWEMALYLEGRKEKVATYGNVAFVCLKKEKGKITNIFYGRNNNPLILDKTNGLYLSSEGSGVSIKPDVLYNLSTSTGLTVETKLELECYKPQRYSAPPTYNYNQSHLPKDFDDEFGDEGHAGDWLPNAVKDAIKRKYLADPEAEEQAEQAQLALGYDSDDEEAILVEVYERKIWDKYLLYLKISDGVFSDAEDFIHNALDTYMAQSILTPKDRLEMSVLDGALDYIVTDPEYKNMKSVSTIWKEYYGSK